MPKPMPPVMMARHTPSSWVWPPRQYTTASAIDAIVLIAKAIAAPRSRGLIGADPRRVVWSPRPLPAHANELRWLRHRQSRGADDSLALRAHSFDRLRRVHRRAGADPRHDQQQRADAEEPRHETLGHGTDASDRQATGILGVAQ